MPLYEFTCPECGYKTEIIQTFKADAPLCPHCRIPTKRGCGSIAFFRLPGELQGSTAGIRKRAEEVTKKTRK